MGSINVMSNPGLKTRFQIQGVPTIKIFGLDKNIPIQYSGEFNVFNVGFSLLLASIIIILKFVSAL